jgi:hypothetical protein
MISMTVETVAKRLVGDLEPRLGDLAGLVEELVDVGEEEVALDTLLAEVPDALTADDVDEIEQVMVEAEPAPFAAGSILRRIRVWRETHLADMPLAV